MSSFLLSLVKQYGRNPGLLARHAVKAGGLLLQGRIADISGQLRHRHAAAQDRAHLAVFTDTERDRASEVYGWLQAYLGNEPGMPAPTGHDLHDVKEMIRAAYGRYALLDDAYYAATSMADLPEGHGLSPMDHFLLHGRYQGAAPNPFFDYSGYLKTYPDVAGGGIDPALHFTLAGWSEGRDPGPAFDPVAYLRANPDVAASGMCPLHHFLSSGRAEGRDPCPKLRGTAPVARSGNLDQRGGSGTLILVSHDTDVGGAQRVLLNYARWLRDRTGYDVRFVTMKGGGVMYEFIEIAPTFNIADHAGDTLSEALAAFCGDDVRAVLLNSIASAGFLSHWQGDAAVLAYIHELKKLLAAHPEELGLLREHASTIIACSDEVHGILRDTYLIPRDQLAQVTASIGEGGEIADAAAKAAAKTALDLDPDRLLVTACGMMHWRKAPQLFVEVAEKVLAQTGAPVDFMWVGGGPDHEACQRAIEEKGLEGRVSISGYVPDSEVPGYLDASDIFLLPSEEDPFPLVCMMAARSRNPIVCFQDAGGIPGLVAEGCGVAVPFLDTDAMAAATLAYIGDDELRLDHADTGRAIIRARYTIATAAPKLLDLTRRAAGLTPAVSVVVPNYNYQDYLPQRLDSIAAQSFQDFEVILLDDASSDGSVAVLRDWAKGRPATRLAVNERNSGSPFAQWIRGMELAQSDLVWIAEADDFCEPTLLETLLPAFDDRNVMLGHVKSVPVNGAGEVQGDYAQMYLDRINPGRWSAPYLATDHEEASEGLGIANCIPNASAVILRRFTPEPGFRDTVTGMRMCGDWLFYLRAMRGGLVAFSDAPLNYHRRHTDTVTSQTEGSPRYFGELQSVRDYVQDHYRLSDTALDKIEEFTTQDLDRFGITDAGERDAILSAATRATDTRAIPSVLFVAPDLSPGGGQMFVIRLANAWVARGGRAVLVNAGYAPTHAKVLSRIDPRVVLIREDDPLQRDLATVVARFDIDLVHSSIWWADKLVRRQIDSLGDIPWITSMHGCHETHLAHPALDGQFPADMALMRGRIDEWVHTAQKNLAVFEVYGTPAHHRRIGNGVPVSAPRPLSRADLGLRDDAVVLCLATRAIESKGWFAAVEMTRSLNAEGHKVDLMLIGEGPARDEIAAAAPEHVHLYGHIDTLHDYIAVSDIGILPSFFVGESMPLVLLEMIGLGKPVVATDVGEIPDMIGTGDTAAGLLVPLRDGTVDTAAFTRALRGLVTSDAERRALGKRAQARFEAHYREEDMMQTYADLYKEVIARKAAARAQEVKRAS